MFANVFWIAHNTFRASIRDKVLYNVFFLSVFMVFFSIILGDWSVFDQGAVIQSFSLMVSAWSGVILAIFVGIMSVQKEIQRRTLYTLLAKPISRSVFLVGKFFGLAWILALQLILLTLMTFIVLWFSQIAIPMQYLEAVLLIYCQHLIVLAFAILFCSFSTPVLSGLFTAGIYVMGHLTNELLQYLKSSQQFGLFKDLSAFEVKLTEYLIQGLYHTVPNLGRMTISNVVVHQAGVSIEYLSMCVLQALVYVVLCLSIATFWFKKRDFI